MIQGNGSTSLRKQDIASQKTPAIGFKKVVFAHQATAGATSINLTSLTTPTGMSGFTNATQAELKNANLLFYRKNLTLVSSLRGLLVDFMSYNVTGNMTITFTDDFGSALEGEVFIGTIDHSAMTGSMVVDAEQIGASGTLTANTTDFNVGTPFTVNAYANRQFGEVMVFLDGVLQFRNSNNSSTVLDGNYYEVDGGNGLGTIIRFNVVDPSNDRDVVVAGIGVVAERPNGSMMAVIESLAGKIDTMSSVVSDLSGLTEYQIVGANPTYLDLKAFGDRVIALEGNRARIDISNTWTASQIMLGRADGAVIPAGYIGEVKTSTVGASSFSASNTFENVTSLSMTAGTWTVTGNVGFDDNGATSPTFCLVAISGYSGNTTTDHAYTLNYASGMPPTGAGGDSWVNISGLIVRCDGSNLYIGSVVIAGTTLYLKARIQYTGSAPTKSGTLTAARIV